MAIGSEPSEAPALSPTVVVVSGFPAAGKTTLAHALAREIGCPAVCRDELKEGMVHAAGGAFEAAYGDPLSVRTLAVFSDVLRVLVEGGVTVVGEAAFQDRLWRHVLESVVRHAEVRLVHCIVDARVAWERAQARRGEATRAAHASGDHLSDFDLWQRDIASFDRVSLPVPSVEVDTTDGYTPSLAEVAAFVRAA